MGMCGSVYMYHSEEGRLFWQHDSCASDPQDLPNREWRVTTVAGIAWALATFTLRVDFSSDASLVGSPAPSPRRPCAVCK